MADEIKLPDIVKEYLENHSELIEYPDVLLQAVQEDLAPMYVGQFTKTLHSFGIDFDLNKLYPQYYHIRLFDLENPNKILPIIKYLNQAYQQIDLKEPISPVIFEKIADHAMVDNLIFLNKHISADIYQIKLGLWIDIDKNSSYGGYIFGRIDFYDQSGVKITDAILDISQDEYLFGVEIPDLGYAINLNKAEIELNRAIKCIDYLAKYFQDK